VKKILFLMFSIILVFGFVASSDAVLIVGDPVDGGSWTQRFHESGVGAFDAMGVFMRSPGSFFEYPGFSNFNKSGWSVENFPSGTATTVIASGTQYTSLDFDIKFYGSKSDPLTFDFVAWYGTETLEVAKAEWTGRKWNIGASSNTYDRPTSAAVPEPATMLLLGSGLVGLAGLGRKKLRRS
jgi:hypothetical protein